MPTFDDNELGSSIRTKLNNALTKVDGIEDGATDDQTGAEIKALYELEPSAFTDAQFTKLAGIETGATADQTGAEIKALYEVEANAFTDAQFTKLAGIETGATADQTDAEIKTAYENNADTNAFTDADESKLDDVMPPFNTVADLLADTNTYSVGTYVHVKDGDFTYKVVASGGDFQNSATTPVHFNAVLAAPYTFRQYNADPTGATDSRDAIQQLIDKAAERKEWEITNKVPLVTSSAYIEPGKYLVGSSLTWENGVKIEGSSPASTKLYHTGSGAFLTYNDGTQEGYGLELSGFSVQDSGSGTNGIAITGGIRQCSLGNIRLADFDYNVYAVDSYTLKIIDPYFYDARTNNIYIENGQSVLINGGRLDNAGDHGVVIKDSATNSGMSCMISNTAIQSCTKAGVWCEDHGNIVFLNNFFEQNNEADASWADIHIADGADDEARMVRIIGGFHTPGSSGATTHRAVHVAEAQLVSIDGIDVRGNAYAKGVELGTGVKLATITGNFTSVGTDVDFDQSTTQVHYYPEDQKNGAGLRIRNGSIASGSWDINDMAASFGDATSGIVGLGAINDIPAIHGGGSGTNGTLSLNATTGNVQIGRAAALSASSGIGLESYQKDIQLNGDWTNARVILNNGYFLWVGNDGNLRLKSSEPTSANDGTIVGTQT